METFIDLYYGKNLVFSDNVVLDDLPGHFVISRNTISFSWIDINYPGSKRTIKVEFHDVNGFKNSLVRILGIRFWRDQAFQDEGKFLLQKAFSDMIHQVQNRDAETCYVCLGNNREYKTPCGHAICYACFVKCLKYTQIDGEDFYEFVCGICRRKKINFCP